MVESQEAHDFVETSTHFYCNVSILSSYLTSLYQKEAFSEDVN